MRSERVRNGEWGMKDMGQVEAEKILEMRLCVGQSLYVLLQWQGEELKLVQLTCSQVTPSWRHVCSPCRRAEEPSTHGGPSQRGL